MLDIISAVEFWTQLASLWMIYSLLGMAFMVTSRAGFTNLGISAQLICGAVASCYIGHHVGYALLSFTACFITCTLIGLAPVAMKVWLNASEVFTTLFATFLAISAGQFMLSGSTNTATPNVPPTSFWGCEVYGGYLTLFHLLAIPSSVALSLLLGPSILGYKIRVLECNEMVFSKPHQRFRILSACSITGSLFVSFVVIGDTYLVNRVYQNGTYDSLGFIGIAVALTALRSPNWVLLSGLLVAGTAQAFLLLSVVYGIPQMAAHVLYGAFILSAAFYRRKGPDESRAD